MENGNSRVVRKTIENLRGFTLGFSTPDVVYNKQIQVTRVHIVIISLVTLQKKLCSLWPVWGCVYAGAEAQRVLGCNELKQSSLAADVLFFFVFLHLLPVFVFWLFSLDNLNKTLQETLRLQHHSIRSPNYATTPRDTHSLQYYSFHVKTQGCAFLVKKQQLGKVKMDQLTVQQVITPHQYVICTPVG